MTQLKVSKALLLLSTWQNLVPIPISPSVIVRPQHRLNPDLDVASQAGTP